MTSSSPSPTCQTEDWLCREVRNATGNDWLAAAADWLIAKPVAIAMIVLLALLVRWVVNRLINRVVTRASGGVFSSSVLRARAMARSGEQQRQAALALDRRRQRAETMATVLKSISSFVILTIVAIMVIAELGYNIGPLIASAGLVGVALGFGAQSLVKDFLAGIFMFFEDQYGVGDRVLIGETEGTVEALALRVTRLRGEDGTVWYVRNGEILRVGNRSQQLAPPPPEQ